MAEQYSKKGVPFITVIWPDDNQGDTECLRGIFHSTYDGPAQFESLESKATSDESAFRDFLYEEFAEALLEYQMQTVWDEIEAAEAANVDTPDC